MTSTRHSSRHQEIETEEVQAAGETGQINKVSKRKSGAKSSEKPSTSVKEVPSPMRACSGMLQAPCADFIQACKPCKDAGTNCTLQPGGKASVCSRCARFKQGCDLPGLMQQNAHDKRELEAKKYTDLQEKTAKLLEEVERLKATGPGPSRIEYSTETAILAATESTRQLAEIMKTLQAEREHLNRVRQKVDDIWLELGKFVTLKQGGSSTEQEIEDEDESEDEDEGSSRDTGEDEETD
jgi:hypothetical protein